MIAQEVLTNKDDGNQIPSQGVSSQPQPVGGHVDSVNQTSGDAATVSTEQTETKILDLIVYDTMMFCFGL